MGMLNRLIQLEVLSNDNTAGGPYEKSLDKLSCISTTPALQAKKVVHERLNVDFWFRPNSIRVPCDENKQGSMTSSSQNKKTNVDAVELLRDLFNLIRGVKIVTVRRKSNTSRELSFMDFTWWWSSTVTTRIRRK